MCSSPSSATGGTGGASCSPLPAPSMCSPALPVYRRSCPSFPPASQKCLPLFSLTPFYVKIVVLFEVVDELLAVPHDVVDDPLYFGDIEEKHGLDWLYVLVHHPYQICVTSTLLSKSSVFTNDYFSLPHAVSTTSDWKYFHSCDTTRHNCDLYADILLSNIISWFLSVLDEGISYFNLLGSAFQICYKSIWVCRKGNRNLCTREKLSSKSWVSTKSSGHDIL